MSVVSSQNRSIEYPKVDGGELMLRDATSGELLLTETNANANEAKAAKQEVKRLARRNGQVEAELQRLRQELDQRGG